ncbi:hypothetical protein BKA70DRAFT_693172 [Coprinopsis sp. MPI-PUGE-AT-0042]|nr:hypothetical protein BKA70DRAFT_693172 [Coprinopsis sp. MPI-PUGE-AT-0042]
MSNQTFEQHTAMKATQTNLPSPPELCPYFKVNDTLPAHLLPLLLGHLSRLGDTIDQLDREIAELETVLNARRSERNFHKGKYDAHRALQAPIRKVPTEILGLIFGFFFGDELLGFYQRYEHAQLCRVCTSWRNVATTTPNLVRGLDVNLDYWSNFEEESNFGLMLPVFQADWDPWINLMNHGSSYHLKITSSHSGRDADTCQRILIPYPLSTEPSPDMLTLESHLPLNIILGI